MARRGVAITPRIVGLASIPSKALRAFGAPTRFAGCGLDGLFGRAPFGTDVMATAQMDETFDARTREPEREAVVKNADGLPLFLTPAEAASLLRTTRKAIYVMIERRQLPGVTRIGRRVLVRTSTLLEWLDQQCASSLQE